MPHLHRPRLRCSSRRQPLTRPRQPLRTSKSSTSPEPPARQREPPARQREPPAQRAEPLAQPAAPREEAAPAVLTTPRNNPADANYMGVEIVLFAQKRCCHPRQMRPAHPELHSGACFEGLTV